MNTVDVLIVGAGAAGLMCGAVAAARGRRVLIVDKSNKAGKKILMSGGGRCNFTNTGTSAEQFLSHNPHFCKSALSCYTQWDFISMVERYGIKYYEKTLGQLFCEGKSSEILGMLLSECEKYKAIIQLNETIVSVNKTERGFIVQCQDKAYCCESLVVASGGLSIPTLGSSPFGYQLAAQFGLAVHPTRAGLVPFTLHAEDKQRFESLSGISVDSLVSCNEASFREHLLFTHRGLSGPAILQISSYWRPGDVLTVKFLPETDLFAELVVFRSQSPGSFLKTILGTFVAKRVVHVLYDAMLLEKPMKQFSDKELKYVADVMQRFIIKPNATEGYRTAEVTLGGVDCNEISSQRFEANTVKGLFFIGEVLDVTGWLGGYNFQWAWSSGWAAGQVV